MRLLLIMLISLILAGCATTPVSLREAKVVPPERIYTNTYLSSHIGAESVAFSRDAGSTGFNCTHVIYIDNERVFALRPGEAIETFLQPGDHYFRLEMGGAWCPNTILSQNTTVHVGKPQAFRISTPSSNNTTLARIR